MMVELTSESRRGEKTRLWRRLTLRAPHQHQSLSEFLYRSSSA